MNDKTDKSTTDTSTTENSAIENNTSVETPPKRDRVYQVSANRGRSRHKVRYVEASAPEEGACKLCVGVMVSDSSPEEDNEADSPEAKETDNKKNNDKDNTCSD